MDNDITQIKRALESRALEFAQYLLPNGQFADGKKEWAVGSVSGEAGDSMKVRVAGSKLLVWQDFASDVKGDSIDLWRAVRGQDTGAALDGIRDWLGIEKVDLHKLGKTKKVWKKPEKPVCTTPKDVVLDWLTNTRKFSKEAISKYRVAQRGKYAVFPSLVDGVLTFVKHRAWNDKKDTFIEADCMPVLFGWQAIDPNAREVTLVEGEPDCLASYDYGFPAMSGPFGGGGGNKQSWIENDFERMARFEVIYLAHENDVNGDKAAEVIADRLGRHRCRRVRLPKADANGNPLKDINDCSMAGIPVEVIRECFEKAETMDPPELVRAGQFVDDVVDLFWPKDDVQPGYSLPWNPLKNKIRFRPGEMTIWTGPTGSGKTQTLSHAKLEFAKQGAVICEASLEMSSPQTLRRMCKQAGNVDRPPEPFIRKIVGWIDEWLWFYNLIGKTSPKKILEIFEYARCRYGCDTFIIDSLMRMGIGSKDYEAQEAAVFEFTNWAATKKVHLHLVAHSRKEDKTNGSGVAEPEDIKGASEIGSNAFNIVAVFRDKKLEDKIKGLKNKAEFGSTPERTQALADLEEIKDMPPGIVNIAKQRNGDFEGKMGVWFNQDSYQYRSAQDDRHGFQYVYMDASNNNHYEPHEEQHKADWYAS